MVSSLYDVRDVCDKTECNVAVLVGTHDQKIYVPTFDWSSYFEKLKFKSIDNLLQYHHFRMSAEDPGFVTCLKTFDDTPVRVRVVEDIAAITRNLPEVIPPKGLSRNRKEYLFTDIREFCTNETKDITAPDPDSY